VIAHLDLDAFFVSVERACDPRLTNRPVVVGGRPGSRGVVAAASLEAREAGVRPGMPLADAARRCSDAVFIEGSFPRYRDAADAVDEIVRRFCPAVEWVSIDEAFLDLTSADRAPGHARQVAERIQDAIRSELTLDVSVGLASSRVVAKIASARAKPRGLLIVLPGYDARFLAPLGLEVLPGIDASVAARLREAGLRTLGELATIDRERLRHLIGPAATVLARHAAGLDDSPVTAERVPRSISREAALDPVSTDPERLGSALQALTERAAHQLRAAGLFARTARVKITYDDFAMLSRSASLRESTALDVDLVAVAGELLGRMLSPNRAVRSIGVVLSGLVEGGRQLSLFPVRDEARALRLARSTDRVRERLAARRSGARHVRAG
jgi:DNA polymerase-4